MKQKLQAGRAPGGIAKVGFTKPLALDALSLRDPVAKADHAAMMKMEMKMEKIGWRTWLRL